MDGGHWMEIHSSPHYDLDVTPLRIWRVRKSSQYSEHRTKRLT
jgi:hypothetical protein